jgi:hypothetical protein
MKVAINMIRGSCSKPWFDQVLGRESAVTSEGSSVVIMTKLIAPGSMKQLQSNISVSTADGS